MNGDWLENDPPPAEGDRWQPRNRVGMDREVHEAMEADRRESERQVQASIPENEARRRSERGGLPDSSPDNPARGRSVFKP